MDLLHIISYLFIGTLTGFFMSTIGVDGLITVPSLIILGLSLKKAVIIALILQVLPQTIPALYNFWKNDDISYELLIISFILVLGNFIGTYYGSFIHTQNLVSDKGLYQFFVFFLLFSAVYITNKHLV
jgi:uncharacterized membrane protein YfcA